MLVADIRTERYDTMRVVRRTPRGDYIEARAPDGGEAFLYVPGDATIYAVEVERLREFRSPCVPAIREVFAGAAGSEAIRFEDVPSAVPLDSAAPLPASLIRTGLVALLSTLSHVHAHDHVHGRIAADSVFLDPSGGFWLLDWGNARRVSSEPYRRRGIQIVARDVRALGAAILSWAGRVDPGGDGEMSPEAAETASRVFAAEDPELARVLVRMASSDPMEAYEFAGEALLDLGARDLSLDNVWLELPQIGRGRMLRRIADAAGEVRRGERSVPSYVLEGGCGTGRTSALRDIARRCREAGHSVVQIEGRDTSAQWEPMASLARQLATRLPSDSPHRGAPEVRALLDAQSPGAARDLPNGSERVAEIAWGLACAARGPEVTVVLVDDEDAMPSHVLGAWRAFCAIAEAGPTDERPVRPRLVLVAATSAPQQPGDTRERHTLRCLTEREVRKLAEVLTDPPRAPVLSGPLWTVSGGRPSEIAAFLRRLDRDGVLRRMGRRWTLTVPEIGAGPEFLEDGVRRAMAAISPEATRMTELLSVTGGAGARRQDIVRIADIPAHRLQAAALECERAGLASRTGDGWRIATPARAERVLAALDDDRRRALEREVLESLLDAAPSAQDPAAIARHARACNDPRAASFCRAAALAHVAALRYEEAAALLDETIATIDPAMADADLQVGYVESLIRRDRRADATARAEAALNDPDLPADIRDRIVLMTFRLSEGVLAPGALARLPLSDALHSPAVRAEVRLWRARTMALAGRIEESEREIRLAEAECGGAMTSAWHAAVAASVRAAATFETARFSESLKHEVESLRMSRPFVTRVRVAHNLYRCYRVLMQVGCETRTLRGIRRLRRRQREAVRADVRLTAQARDIEIYIEHWQGEHGRCSIRHVAALTGTIEKIEPANYLFSVCGLLLSRIEHGRVTWKDRRDTKDLIWLLQQPLGRNIHFRYARCALFFGFHLALRAAVGGLRWNEHTPYDRDTILLAAVRACMIENADPSHILGVPDGVRLAAHALACADIGDMLLTLRSRSPTGPANDRLAPGIAAFLLRTTPTEFDKAISSRTLCQAGISATYEEDELQLTLLTEPITVSGSRVEVSPELHEASLAKRAPNTMEWRRLLRLAIEARNACRVRDSESLVAEARSSVRGMRDCEIGPSADVMREHALRVIDSWGFSDRRATASGAVSSAGRPSLSETREAPPDAASGPRLWRQVERALASGNTTLVTATSAVEADVFGRMLERCGSLRVVRRAGDIVHDSAKPLLLLGADVWPESDLRAIIHGLLSKQDRAAVRAVLVQTLGAARASSPLVRCLVDSIGRSAEDLPNPLEDREARAETINWVRHVAPEFRANWSREDYSLVLAHDWPGGLQELMEATRAMFGIAKAGSGAIGLQGWIDGRGTRSRRVTSGTSRIEAQIESALRRSERMRLAELVTVTGAPRRTVQRAAALMVARGLVRRGGRGRATVYSLA